MRMLLMGVLLLLGCAPSLSRPLVDGVVASAPAEASLLVRGGAEADTPDAWAVFLPVEFDDTGLDGWSADALRSAGYRIAVVEFEDIVESTPARDLRGEPDELLSRRPPRRGGPGGPSVRSPPLCAEKRCDVPDSHRLPQAAHAGVQEGMGLREAATGARGAPRPPAQCLLPVSHSPAHRNRPLTCERSSNSGFQRQRQACCRETQVEAWESFVTSGCP